MRIQDTLPLPCVSMSLCLTLSPSLSLSSLLSPSLFPCVSLVSLSLSLSISTSVSVDMIAVVVDVVWCSCVASIVRPLHHRCHDCHNCHHSCCLRVNPDPLLNISAPQLMADEHQNTCRQAGRHNDGKMQASKQTNTGTHMQTNTGTHMMARCRRTPEHTHAWEHQAPWRVGRWGSSSWASGRSTAASAW